MLEKLKQDPRLRECTTIYISGGISGRNFAEADLHFSDAAVLLESLGKRVKNPMNNPVRGSWEGYMKDAIPQLCSCDAIYLLTGWTESRGAREEFYIAELLKMPVFYEEDYITQPPTK